MAGIVSTEWLADHFENEGLRILDTRGSFTAYEEAHIPHAQMLHIETLRMSEDGIPCKIFPPDVLGVIFGRLSITTDTSVVIYAANPVDHISATYTGWSLAVTGNPNILILDGGMEKWEDEDLPLTQLFPNVTTTTYVPAFDESIFADWQYVYNHLEDPTVLLVDTRTHAMYIGASGPTQRLGHIPGAVLHNYIWDFRRDGTYLPVQKLRQRYEEAGITPDKEIVTYCNTGREGSAAWFILKVLLGYPRVRLYQASMTEWAAHPELPLVTGDTPMGKAKAA